MKAINLVFDDDYEDVSILLVPDNIADNINNIMHEFNKWLKIPQNSERFLVPHKGTMVLNICSKEFLWWLNNCKIIDESKAIILDDHAKFCPNYPRADL